MPSEVPDDVKAAVRACLDEYIGSNPARRMRDAMERAIMAERERCAASLSAAEPVGVRCTGCGSSWDDERLAEERAKRPALLSCCPERKVIPVYAAPPAPSVAVKALEWEDRGDTIRDRYKASSVIGDYYVSREKSGLFSYRTYALSGTIIVGNAEEAKSAAQADYEARIRSALSAQVQDVATHRHKKRGTEYVLMGVGKMQAENWQVSVDGFDQSIDMQEVAVYRSVDDGSLWVRPVEEFNDGRFEPLPAAPAKQEG